MSKLNIVLNLQYTRALAFSHHNQLCDNVAKGVLREGLNHMDKGAQNGLYCKNIEDLRQ
jgi:hypothetical protein